MSGKYKSKKFEISVTFNQSLGKRMVIVGNPYGQKFWVVELLN